MNRDEVHIYNLFMDISDRIRDVSAVEVWIQNVRTEAFGYLQAFSLEHGESVILLSWHSAHPDRVKIGDYQFLLSDPEFPENLMRFVRDELRMSAEDRRVIKTIERLYANTPETKEDHGK
jgi:hypothetical protein